MRRVTDFRIDTVEIAETDFYSLPEKAQEMLRTYATFHKASRPDTFRFELPISRWQEINAVCGILELPE